MKVASGGSRMALFVFSVVLILFAYGCSSEKEKLAVSFHQEKPELISLINQRKFALAEKKMEKYDVPELSGELSKLRNLLEETRTADHFHFNRKKIEAKFESMIAQNRLDMAEKEIQKYDIPILSLELVSFKKRLAKAREGPPKDGKKGDDSKTAGIVLKSATPGEKRPPLETQPADKTFEKAKYYFK